MKKEKCPRCGEKNYVTVLKPDRRIKMVPGQPGTDYLEDGDMRYHKCEVCGYWANARYDKPTRAWIWDACPPLSGKRQNELTMKLDKMKKKRRRTTGRWDK